MASVFSTALRNLSDESQYLTIQLLGMLSGPNRTEIKAFATLWPTIAVDRRREAIAKLVEQGEDRFDVDFSAIFRICLGDPDAEVRRSAVEGLWEDESADLVDIFIQMMRTDADTLVRAKAASSLGSFVYMAECEDLDPKHAASVRPALEQIINNPEEDPEVVRRAVEAISFINDEQIRSIIERTYAQREERMKVSALFAMGRNADQYWADIVMKELSNASAVIRFEAVRSSGELTLKQAVPQLIELVKDMDDEVQAMAIWALGQVGGKEAEAALHKLAKSKNEALSEAALDALSELEFISSAMEMLEHDVETDLEDMTEVNLEEDNLDEDDDESSDETWDDDPI